MNLNQGTKCPCVSRLADSMESTFFACKKCLCCLTLTSIECLRRLTFLDKSCSQKITQIKLFCHLQPALYSHAGNVLFLGWECFIPKVGTTQDNKERVLRNKGWLLNNKGWLLENKRRLSLDLTWFLGKVPK